MARLAGKEFPNDVAAVKYLANLSGSWTPSQRLEVFQPLMSWLQTGNAASHSVRKRMSDGA